MGLKEVLSKYMLPGWALVRLPRVCEDVTEWAVFEMDNIASRKLVKMLVVGRDPLEVIEQAF